MAIDCHARLQMPYFKGGSVTHHQQLVCAWGLGGGWAWGPWTQGLGSGAHANAWGLGPWVRGLGPGAWGQGPCVPGGPVYHTDPY